MNYLDLTNAVLVELNEVPLTSLTFASATGFHANAKRAVNTAIYDIYKEQDCEWPFAWTEITLSLVAGTQTYNKNASLITVDWDSFWLKKATSPIQAVKLDWIDYDTYRNWYLTADKNAGDALSYGKSNLVVRKPDNNFIVTAIPDMNYTLTYEGFVSPTALVADTDVPGTMPGIFEQAIVDRALHYSYMFRDNLEQAQLAYQRYKDNIFTLRRVFIPQANTMRFDG